MTASPPPIRFGVLGTGRIARKVGPAIARSPGAELVAIASREPERAEAWAREHRTPRACGSYSELLDEIDLDAVYIALPPSLHCEWTVKAACRGRHVLCEKPLAPTAAEAAEMVVACREHGVRLMDGVMWVHTPRAAMMRAVLDAGTLGPLRRVTSAFSFRANDWQSDEIRLNPSLGGGCLLDLGWYCVGVSLWAFGERPVAVTGWGSPRSGLETTFSGVLHFSDGRTAGFDCGYETAARRWVEIAGHDGSLICDDFTRPWNSEKSRFWTHGHSGKADEHHSEPFAQEESLVAAFCRLVRSPGMDETWAATALKVQRICDALLASAREGRTIELKL